METELLFAIWHKPGNEWLTDRQGRVFVFPESDAAENLRALIDTKPASMEVRPFDGDLDTVRYERK